MRHPEWKNQEVYYWMDEYHTGLQIDFVALRDIAEDEEILIDYGIEWETAWQKHIEDFVPARENYVPAFELNEMEDVDYRIHGEDDDYASSTVQLWCHGWYIWNILDIEDADTECRILKKLGDDRYRVQLIYTEYNDEDGYHTIEPGKILWSVPSDIFYFADIPYTRDHYNANAFRHRMMFPDDIFPEQWKNVGKPRPAMDTRSLKEEEPLPTHPLKEEEPLPTY